MTKQRVISLRDYVMYGGSEYIVVGKTERYFKLVRRQVCKGGSITVFKKRVKLADQSWRTRLVNGDTLCLFVYGEWAPASVYASDGVTVDVQLSFSNHIINLPVHSSRIVRKAHDFPLWSPSVSKFVLANGKLALSRGPGLVYPWTYTSYVNVPQPKHTKVAEFQFDMFPVKSHPISMYHRLSTQEIVYDLYNSNTRMPNKLHLLVCQYVATRFRTIEVQSDADIGVYIDVALEHHDDKRVQELLSIGEKNAPLFKIAEWLMQLQCEKPVFDLAFELKDKKLHVSLLWTGITASTSSLAYLYSVISEPIPYTPPQYVGISAAPDIRFTLSRMLGMEEQPLQNMYERKLGSTTLTIHAGVNSTKKKTFGGVVCVYALRTKLLVAELMKRKPLKTLVVVDASSISLWDCKRYYGRRREDGDLVVTTKNTFMRHTAHFNTFERIVCVSLPVNYSTFYHSLRDSKIKTRWAICNPDNVERAWVVHGLPRDERGEIYLTRERQLSEGVEFPTIHLRFHQCAPGNTETILKNTRLLPIQKRVDTVCKFLLHPSLVSEHFGGERLDAYEGTVKSIAEKINVKQEMIEEHLEDKCAVCLSDFDVPTVTTCGHIFCDECTKELKKRGICCPMCRSDIDGYMRISNKDTEGKIVMHRGNCYRVTEKPEWGAKMDFLRKYPQATIISRFSAVLSKLRKVLPNRDMYTLKAHKGGRRPKRSTVILLEPCRETPNFETPFGQDIDLIILSYPVEL